MSIITCINNLNTEALVRRGLGGDWGTLTPCAQRPRTGTPLLARPLRGSRPGHRNDGRKPYRNFLGTRPHRGLTSGSPLGRSEGRLSVAPPAGQAGWRGVSPAAERCEREVPPALPLGPAQTRLGLGLRLRLLEGSPGGRGRPAPGSAQARAGCLPLRC